MRELLATMSASAACRFGLPVRRVTAQDRSEDGRARLWGVTPDFAAIKHGRDAAALAFGAYIRLVAARRIADKA